MSFFFDLVGWIGMITVLVAYCLLSFKKISAGATYQLLNLFASLLMAIGLFPKNAWFSFALQVAWGIIAIISLIRLGKKSKKRRKN